MRTPTPHNFQTSPVVEVLCRWTEHTGVEQSCIITAPYPDWPAILTRIRDLLPSSTFPVTGCHLRYIDEFSIQPDHAAEICAEHPDIASSPNMHAQTRIPNTSATIRMIQGPTQKTLSYLFTLQSDDTYTSADELLTWFNHAHADIHYLFERTVHETFIHELRTAASNLQPVSD